MKAIYHILNQFSLRDAQRVLIGECWMPTSDIPMIKNAINIGAQNAGSSVTPTLERVPTTEEHPTFNRTNKYTAVFQVNLFNANLLLISSTQNFLIVHPIPYR